MLRKKIRPPLSEAQLEIMQIVWQHDEITVSDVWQAIAARRSVARNTVLTVMDRLEKRGWLSKRSVGNTHLYQATASERVTLGQAVRRFVDSTFGGSADALVMALLDGGGVSREEAARIRKRIDKASGKTR
jgi:predicted transcriptional regulator